MATEDRISMPARQSGGLAAFQALRDLTDLAERTNVPSGTFADHYRDLAAASDILTEAFKPSDDRQVGFLAAVAEYLMFTLQAGEPNLADGGWRPEAALNPHQVAAKRHELENAGHEVAHG